MSAKTGSSKKNLSQQGGILLEDGSFWPGRSFGSIGTRVGECVFNTAHSGYQEILTDPSYLKQIIVFSSVQIGNQGFHEDDFESSSIWASGCVARDYSEAPYHWRKQKALSDVLSEFKVPGLSGVDTRRLIVHLRNHGALWGVISGETSDVKKMKSFLKAGDGMTGLSLSSEVSTPKIYRWSEGSRALVENRNLKVSRGGKRCVVVDLGVKRQILRFLVDVGFHEILVMPAQSTAEAILNENPDGILLSNGPGDPAAESFVIEQVKKLIGRKPILGICLGHQILGLALGLKTYKLKFGHHAANHPVLKNENHQVAITSQNHGFAVEASSAVDLSYEHLNDHTVSGFQDKKQKVFAVQFHPEAAPGPWDSVDVFQKFREATAA